MEMKGVVGFVPTMGALHLGHQSLIEKARESCDHVVVSIYVNPTQFGPNEDFAEYPRTRQADLKRCEDAGADLVWFPSTEQMYPAGCMTVVQVKGLGERFEGASRPGHFVGVATVVTKLLNAVAPNKAYFGQKDLQQLLLIQQMVRDLHFGVEVVAVPTARESNGLARSSRNRYLSDAARARAGEIFGGLQAVQQAHASGLKEAASLRDLFDSYVQKIEGARLERFDLSDPFMEKSYREEECVESGYCSVAVELEGVRLIDNIALCC